MRADPGVVLVSGGASGLGAAVVRAVAEAGGTPLVLDLRPPDHAAEHAIVDVTRPREAEAAVRELGQLHGGLDGVVTTAGIDVPGPVGAVDAEQWERVIAVNLVGTAAVIRAALPDLEQRGGRIVTVASTLGFSAVGDATAYCASKFGSSVSPARWRQSWPAGSASPWSLRVACARPSSTGVRSSTGPGPTPC